MSIHVKLAIILIIAIDLIIGSSISTTDVVDEKLGDKMDPTIEKIKKSLKSPNGNGNDNGNSKIWTEEKPELVERTKCVGYSYDFFALCVSNCNIFLKGNFENRTKEIEGAIMFKSCRMKFCPSKALDVYHSCAKKIIMY